MCGAPPDELATVALAVLDVNVAATVLKAAVLEDAVDKDPLVQNDVLVLERLGIVTCHGRPLRAAVRRRRHGARAIPRRTRRVPSLFVPLEASVVQ